MKSLKGHLLVATPQLLDPNFFQAVLLMFDHTADGAAGVILNRPAEATVGSIAPQAFDEPLDWGKPIHIGGPVPGPLLALHAREDLSDQEILPGLFSTVEAAKLKQLAEEQVEPSHILVNYAGWGPGQLERELAEESWLWLPARVEHVFCPDETELWKAVVAETQGAKLGSMLGLRDLPTDPKLN